MTLRLHNNGPGCYTIAGADLRVSRRDNGWMLYASSDPARAWLDEQVLRHVRFATLTEVRRTLTTYFAASPPPPARPLPALTRWPDGTYRTREQDFTVRRAPGRGRPRWELSGVGPVITLHVARQTIRMIRANVGATGTFKTVPPSP